MPSRVGTATQTWHAEKPLADGQMKSLHLTAGNKAKASVPQKNLVL